MTSVQTHKVLSKGCCSVFRVLLWRRAVEVWQLQLLQDEFAALVHDVLRQPGIRPPVQGVCSKLIGGIDEAQQHRALQLQS